MLILRLALNALIVGTIAFIIAEILYNIYYALAQALHKTLPNHRHVPTIALALACAFFWFAWSYDGQVLEATQKDYINLCVEKEFLIDARDGYRKDVALADQIIAALEPYANDEQKDMIASYRAQKTVTLEELASEYQDYLDSVTDFADSLTEAVTSMITASNATAASVPSAAQ